MKTVQRLLLMAIIILGWSAKSQTVYYNGTTITPTNMLYDNIVVTNGLTKSKGPGSKVILSQTQVPLTNFVAYGLNTNAGSTYYSLLTAGRLLATMPGGPVLTNLNYTPANLDSNFVNDLNHSNYTYRPWLVQSNVTLIDLAIPRHFYILTNDTTFAFSNVLDPNRSWVTIHNPNGFEANFEAESSTFDWRPDAPSTNVFVGTIDYGFFVQGTTVVGGFSAPFDENEFARTFNARLTNVTFAGTITADIPFMEGQTLLFNSQGELEAGSIPGAKAGYPDQFDTDSSYFWLKPTAQLTNIYFYGLRFPGLTANRVLLTDGAGNATNSPTVDSTELGYLNGATGPVQAQIDFKVDLNDGLANRLTIDNQTNNGAIYGTFVRNLFIPASYMISNTTEGATFATAERFSPTNRMDDYYIFLDAVTNRVQFKLMFPESWNAGTIKAKFAFGTTNANATQTNVFAIAATAFSHDDVQTGDWGTEQIVRTPITAANDFLLSAATPAITIAGSPANGDMISFRISRLGGHADDAMTSTSVNLQGVWLQYTETRIGVTAW